MGEKAEEVEIIKKATALANNRSCGRYNERRSAPSLNEISNIAKEVKIVGYEDKNQTMIFALTLSVMLKGIARGDVDILRFFL